MREQAIPINTMVATRFPNEGAGTGLGIGEDGDAGYTITAGHEHAVCAGFKYHQGAKAGGVGFMEGQSPTLTADYHNPAVAECGSRYVVRRLTPLECERLQGFPDGWTDIPYKGEEHPPDSPRYKALGNSWAVPCAAWIGERMQEVDGMISG